MKSISLIFRYYTQKDIIFSNFSNITWKTVMRSVNDKVMDNRFWKFNKK